MINPIQYNSDTKSFSGFWDKASTVASVGSMAAAVGGLGLQAYNQLRDQKYEVIWLTSNGKATSKVVRGASANNAISKVKALGPGSKYRAFEIPAENQQAQDYKNSLG